MQTQTRIVSTLLLIFSICATELNAKIGPDRPLDFEKTRYLCDTSMDRHPLSEYKMIINETGEIDFYPSVSKFARFHAFKTQPTHIERLNNEYRFFWSLTRVNRDKIFREWRACGNYVHDVFDVSAHFDTKTGQLNLSQTTIDSIFNTCGWDYQAARTYRPGRPQVTTLTSIFKCTKR